MNKDNKVLRVYLAGACKNVPDEGREWREQVSVKLKQIGEWASCEVLIFNPLDYFSYSDNRQKSHKQVMSYYYHNIKNCDLILVNLNNTNISCGTCMEIQYATDHDIPVVGFGTEEVYSWLLPSLEVQFNNATEALDYLRDYYMR